MVDASENDLLKSKIYIIITLFSIIVTLLVYRSNFFIPQIALMFLSPYLLFKEKVLEIDRLPVVLIFVILLTSMLHPDSFRIATVGYSILYITTYLYYTCTLNKCVIEPSNFQTLLKRIIQAYAVVLTIQLLSRLIGLDYVLNASYNTEEGFKFNSLTFEASQIGPIITILMFAYLKIDEIVLGRTMTFGDLVNKKNKTVFFAYVFTSLFSLSVTTYFSLLVFLLYFVRLRYIIIGAITLTTGIIVFFALGTDTGNRILALLEVIPSLDVQTIYKADSSASARIAPILIFFKEFDLLSFNTWFGYGCDYGNLHIWHELIGDESSDESLAVVGIFGFIYDYGIIAFSVFIKFILSLCKFKSHMFFIYMTCFFLTGFNMASTWLFFMLVYTLNYFEGIEYGKKNIDNYSHIQC